MLTRIALRSGVDCAPPHQRLQPAQHRHHIRAQLQQLEHIAAQKRHPVDLWTVLRTGGLAVDNDETVIHRARLCPQAPQGPNHF
jgi:hypothetical protein